ncbi:unnamed protein product [Leptidea sinapis]|uniref:Ion transport domain-containing protein n=1 Tax=Leptidea sinapis TaxID=189913 RepID=A0A5E4PQN5_9NEOP|nr:unnamed protein product [Leptidea sinapis]
MIFRVIIVVISITSASLQGGSGAVVRVPLTYIGEFCDVIGIVDIIIKGFLAFYIEKGILITHIGKCWKHYLSRGFILDVLGCAPMYLILNIILPSNIDENNEVLLNTIMKFAHLYMLLGYFNYIADSPTKNIAFYMILKFHILSILVVLGTSSYFVSRCIDFGWDAAGQLVTMTRRNECWIPSFIPLDENPTLDQLHMVYAESFNLAQCGLMRFHLGRFRIDRENFGVGITLVILGILFWFITCYSLTLLVLNFRGNTLFQHRVRQLRRFLEAERVEKHIIVQANKRNKYT